MRLKYAADGRPTMLYADLAFSVSFISLFVKPSQKNFNIIYERDITFLYIRVAVVVVQYPLSPSKMNPFMGCVDGENPPYVIICGVVLVPDLRIRKILTSPFL